MRVIKDKDPIFYTEKYDVILVGTSIACSLSSGFQGKIARKYPYVDEANDKLPYRDNRRLGNRLTLKRDGKPTISLWFICKFADKRYVTIDYNALENSLATANAEFKGMKVMTTVLGGTKVDGNGVKEECLRIINDNTKDIDIDVYDYEQMLRSEEMKKLFYNLNKYWIDNKLRPSKQETKDSRAKLSEENFINAVSYNGKFY